MKKDLEESIFFEQEKLKEYYKQIILKPTLKVFRSILWTEKRIDILKQKLKSLQ